MSIGKNVSICIPQDKVNLYLYATQKQAKSDSTVSDVVMTALHEYSLRKFTNTHITDLAQLCISDGRFDLVQRHVDKDGSVVIIATPKAQKLYGEKLRSWNKAINETTGADDMISVPRAVSEPAVSEPSFFPKVNPVTEMIAVSELIRKMRYALQEGLVLTLSDYEKQIASGGFSDEEKANMVVYVDSAHKSAKLPVKSIVLLSTVKNKKVVVSATYDDLLDYVKPRVAFAIATDSEGKDIVDKNGKPVYIPCGLDINDKLDKTVKPLYIDMDVE